MRFLYCNRHHLQDGFANEVFDPISPRIFEIMLCLFNIKQKNYEEKKKKKIRYFSLEILDVNSDEKILYLYCGVCFPFKENLKIVENCMIFASYL